MTGGGEASHKRSPRELVCHAGAGASAGLLDKAQDFWLIMFCL